MFLHSSSWVVRVTLRKKFPGLNFWRQIGILGVFFRLKIIAIFDDLRKKLPQNLQFQQLVFDSLGSPWRTSVPRIFVLNMYCKIMYLKSFLVFSQFMFNFLPVLCSKCWRPRTPRHQSQCCSSSSSPSTPRGETFFRQNRVIDIFIKDFLSHMTTSSARRFSWISPSYANLFSPSPAGTCKRRNM